MKRLLVVLMALAIVLMSAAAVWAGPTDVGGSCAFTPTEATGVGPAVYKGKGNPQGNPFQPAVVLRSPTDVGGS